MAATFKIKVAGREIVIQPHGRPVHLDEFGAARLMEKFGDLKFLRRYAKEGVIMVGFGGGEFDEHPTPTRPRKKGECATTLVAKALGIEKEPGLQRLLAFIRSRDLGGGGHSFDLAGLAQMMSKDSSLQKTYEWVREGLEAIYSQGSEFEEVATPEYGRVVREVIIQAGTRQLKIAILRSNDDLVSKVAISASRGRAAIAIQQWSDGHVKIFAQKRLIHDLDDVARMLRLAEQDAEGKPLQQTTWDKVASEGTITGAERWYYHRTGPALFNGRDPHDWEVPPTRLPLEQILAIVKIGINPNDFPRHCRGRCLLAGCGWYTWGLARCQERRRIR